MMALVAVVALLIGSAVGFGVGYSHATERHRKKEPHLPEGLSYADDLYLARFHLGARSRATEVPKWQ